MKKKLRVSIQKVISIVVLSLFACAAPKNEAIVNIKDLKTGVVLGRARFIETNKGVLFKIDIQTKKDTTLAVHIHENGTCVDVEGKSAGGHWNPTKELHGAWGVGNFHSGDLGNIKTDKNGKGSLEVLDVFGRWSLDAKTKTTAINKAIIIHAGIDDMTSQPSGAAGKRIGCGVIKKIK